MSVEFRKMFLPFEAWSARPALPDLLEEQVPSGFTPVLRRRLRSENGKVVHGPVHREVADVPAWEKERGDHVGVGCLCKLH